MANTAEDLKVIKIEVEDEPHTENDFDSYLFNEEDDEEQNVQTSLIPHVDRQASKPCIRKGLAHLPGNTPKETKRNSPSFSEEYSEDGWTENDDEDEMEIQPVEGDDNQTVNVKIEPLDAIYTDDGSDTDLWMPTHSSQNKGWISTNTGDISGDASHDFGQHPSQAETGPSSSQREKSLQYEDEYSQDPNQASSSLDQFDDETKHPEPLCQDNGAVCQDGESNTDRNKNCVESETVSEQEDCQSASVEHTAGGDKLHESKGRRRREKVCCSCPVCDKVFTKTKLKYHMKIHTGEKAFKCSICEKSFTLKGNLTAHMRIHTGERPYECTVCKKTFIENSKLSIHMRCHTGVKPYQCNYCDKAFSQKGDVLRHTRIHTGEKPYQCSICSKGFIESGKLAIHMRSHTGVKPHQCTFCDKGFNDRSTLLRHLSTHTQRETHQCSVCEKSFFHAKSLEAHTRIHTGENLSQCDICDKTFTTSDRLTRHMITHSKEKAHKCEVCNKRFSYASTLSSHRRLHTGENLVNCGVCNKIFTSGGQLTKHMKIHKVVKSSSD